MLRFSRDCEHHVGRSRGTTPYLPQSEGIDDVLPDREDHDQDIDDIACKLPHNIVDVLSAWEDDDEDQDFDDIVYTLTPVDLELVVAAWEVHCELITL